MSLLRAKAPQNREKRLDAVSAYLGEAQALAREFREPGVTQRIRTFAQSSHDDLLYALQLISGIRDAVTVIHGPRGCAAAELYFHAAGEGGRWGVTNLDERDTIMGADAKLRVTITALYRRHRPQVIFVVATPVVAINSDDIQSVVEELRDELDAVIVPVYSSGFASKAAVTGYDTALHALVKSLARGGEGNREEFVNLLSVAESRADRQEIGRLLGALGVALNILPDGSRAADFARATRARLSIAINPDYGDYLGKILESEHAVPYLHPPRPIGIDGTGGWLAAVGEATELAPAAAKLHARESAGLRKELAGAALKGVRVYASLPAATAFGVVQLVEELGGEVIGVTVEHLDRLHISALENLQAERPELQIHVAHGQPFEEVNILGRLAPDLYIGASGHQALAARLGIPVVSLTGQAILGYRGVRNLARQAAKALGNRAFIRTLAQGAALPYQESWYRRSPNWHIKQEVK